MTNKNAFIDFLLETVIIRTSLADVLQNRCP